VIILIGVIVLNLRRRADGSRSGYKLLLVLLGILLGLSTIGAAPLFPFDPYFLKSLSVFLLVVLLFELSIRLNPDNIRLTKKNITLFFTILIVNIIFLSIAASFLLKINFLSGVVFALIMSSVEYFLVDYLKEEGDLANPLVIFFGFGIMIFYGLQDTMINNVYFFLKYLLIGLGTGVIVGIMVFKSMKNKPIDSAHELGLIAVAVSTYIITEQLAGSGLFAVMVLGMFFGNSYVRKTSSLRSFSPFIFKSLEMLIYLLIGFVVVVNFSDGLWWKSLAIFFLYILLRFIVIHFTYRRHSIQNKLLLTFAPKGMIVGVMILVLGVYHSVEQVLINATILILVYSLIAGMFIEYIEHKKMLRLDKLFKILVNIRFGRKRDLPRLRHPHTYHK
jgi:NhaP-type Na+/H+ and K+/H+ antiporter